MIPRYRIGIDLGGTKIEGVLMDGTGVVQARLRVPTPQADYSATLRAAVGIVTALEEQVGGRATVGVGMPGSLSKVSGRVRNANSTCLNGKLFGQDFEGALGRPVRLANDANCFVLSEAIDGAGQGYETVFGVILGTGVGGGICRKRDLHAGCNLIAGEWGHNPLPWAVPAELPGPSCYCGKQGCIETFLSGPGLADDYFRATGNRLTGKEIATRAQSERACQDALGRYAVRLAKSLATVINLLDPDVIVLGGGLSGIGSLYEQVPSLWQDYVFSDRVDTKLVPPTHGDSSGVRGAAWLWDLDGSGMGSDVF